MCRQTVVLILICFFVQQANAQRSKKNASFNAPVIYSLAGDSSEHSAPRIPAPARKDSLPLKPDTVVIMKADTTLSQNLNRKLDSIQFSVLQIKKLVLLQSFEVRWKHLLFQRDSVRQLRMKVQSQKIIAGEDRLKIQIYTLQADSISNQMIQLQHRLETGGLTMDTLEFPAFLNSSSNNLTGLPGIPSPAMLQVDTLQYADSITATIPMQPDLRGTRDSSHPAMADSLKKTQQTSIMGAAVKTDSLQTEIMNIRGSMQKNNDSLRALQLSVKNSMDSAALYREKIASARKQFIDDSLHNSKWYNRLLPGKRSNKNDDEWNQTVQKNTAQADYYERQLQNLNDKVERLQRRNNELSDNYKTYDKQRNVTVRTYTDPPAYAAAPAIPLMIPATGSNNSEESARLRHEISALTAQLQKMDSLKAGRDTVLSKNIVKEDTQVIVLKNELRQLQNQFRIYQKEQSAKTDSLKTIPAPVVVKDSAPPTVKTKSSLTIYFSSGSASVSGLQNEKLRAFLNQEEKKNDANYSIAGFTDATGSAAVNIALALKRMKRIQEIMITTLDLPADKFSLLAPVIDTNRDKKNSALDRKVIITRIN